MSARTYGPWPASHWRARNDERLCQAAPELLSALKMARKFVEGEAEQRQEQIGESSYSRAPITLLVQIDAAIAKAEGK